MTDLIHLVLPPLLAFLNMFVVLCHLLDHTLGSGWGFPTLLTGMVLSWVVPGVRYWQLLREEGMSSDEAREESSWVFVLGFAVTAVIGGYVYLHGGRPM